MSLANDPHFQQFLHSHRHVATPLGTVFIVSFTEAFPPGARPLTQQEGQQVLPQLKSILQEWSIVGFDKGAITGSGYGFEFKPSFGPECGEGFVVDESINATPEEGNLYKWSAFIEGPEGTAWEGGLFELQMDFTLEYPAKAPNVKFLSKVFHPNVYADGRICLDILQNQWSPIYDVWAVLTSLRSLLSDPNPSSPANSEAAQLYSSNRVEYDRRVREIVEKSLE
ncbi:unnamed protein product [Sphagnum balticum]